jgi:hypothetical protein
MHAWQLVCLVMVMSCFSGAVYREGSDEDESGAALTGAGAINSSSGGITNPLLSPELHFNSVVVSAPELDAQAEARLYHGARARDTAPPAAAASNADAAAASGRGAPVTGPTPKTDGLQPLATSNFLASADCIPPFTAARARLNEKYGGAFPKRRQIQISDEPLFAANDS